MNILYLAHRIPYPPDKGDKLRAFHQLAHLAQAHRVWCACFVDDPADRAHVETLRRYCVDVVAPPLHRLPALWRAGLALLSGATFTEGYYACPRFDAALDAWRRSIEFDTVLAFSSAMAPWALRMPAGRRVLDLCDLDSRKWLAYARTARGPGSILYGVEGTRLAQREAEWCRAFDATILITEEEATELRPSVPRERLHIVGNGVVLPDLSVFPEAERPVVGFVGVMDYHPNVDAVCWFARAVWPAVRAACPQAIFRIVGRRPKRAVRHLARLPGVEVTGAVPDAGRAVAPFQVSVAPLRIARGLQNKVLEAMAAAKPVVLTTPAATGIPAAAGQEFIIADTADTMAAAVIRLLQDADLRGRVGQAARAHVARHQRWDLELARFAGVVEGQANPSPPPCDIGTAHAPTQCVSAVQ